MMRTSRLLLTAALAAGLASSAVAQQELYALARFNKIFRIDDYQSATPVPVEITTWGTNGLIGEPTGLAIDPDTGHFLVMASPWTKFSGNVSEVVDVDPLTGAGTVVMTLPTVIFSGLDRRWDGKLYTLRDGVELWLLDLDAGTWTIEPLANTVGGVRPSLAVDPSGLVLSETGDLALIDPFSGDVTAGVLPGSGLPLPLGLEIDADGQIYQASAISAVDRYDPGTGTWTNIFGSFNVMNNIYDLAFTEVLDGAGYSETCAGLPNSTGQGSTLELLGSSSAAGNDLELITRQLPPATFAYYLVSELTASVPVGDGILCLGSPVYRYNSSVLVSDPGGTVRFPLDLGQLAGGQVALPGDTYHFQLWHRDFTAGPTSNLSAAAGVTFE